MIPNVHRSSTILSTMQFQISITELWISVIRLWISTIIMNINNSQQLWTSVIPLWTSIYCIMDIHISIIHIHNIKWVTYVWRSASFQYVIITTHKAIILNVYNSITGGTHNSVMDIHLLESNAKIAHFYILTFPGGGVIWRKIQKKSLF